MQRDQKYVVIARRDAFEEEIGYFLNDVYYELATGGAVGKKEGNRFIYNGKDEGFFEAAALIRNDGETFWLRLKAS